MVRFVNTHFRPLARCSVFLALLAVGTGLSARDDLVAQGMRPADLLRLQQVVSAYPSPDGKRVAFVRRVPRPFDDGAGSARAHLHVLDENGKERRLIGGKKSVRGIAWSPDGAAIHYLSSGDGHTHREVYALPMQGGEPVRLTKTKRGIASYKWAPNGEHLAYVMRDARSELRTKNRKRGFKAVIVDEDWVGTSLWLWNAKSGESTRLTKGGAVNSFEWSQDGSKIAAGISPRNLVDDRYMFSRLHVVRPFESPPSVKKLVDNPGKLGGYAWSPDGRHLAYISGADRRDPHAGMLYVVEEASGKTGAMTDGFVCMVHEVKWPESAELILTVSVGVTPQLWRVSLAPTRLVPARIAPITAMGPAFRAHRTSKSGGRQFVVGSTARHPAELFEVEKAGFKRLTNSNPWLADVALGDQQVFKFKTRGLEIEGLLMYPVGYEKGRRYPLVIVAHGGPEAHFSNGWNTDYGRWGQLLCARGYFAWYPNYRASTGYGVEFAKADHGDPMGGEFEDHVDAINEFDKLGLIDTKRVGLGGGSYGGYTAAWAATKKTRHFAAAVSFVPFVDIRTKWLTSDIPHEFHRVHYEEKWPHEQVAFLAERSPLTYAQDCRTPLLLAGGTSDPRVHPSQPFMLYRAIKFATETPVRYVQYPAEGHGNRTNVYRFDYCVRSLRWFDHYLKAGEHRADPLPPMDIDYAKWGAPK